jgi:hypothetical protein
MHHFNPDWVKHSTSEAERGEAYRNAAQKHVDVFGHNNWKQIGEFREAFLKMVAGIRVN